MVAGHVRLVVILYNSYCMEFAWMDSALVVLVSGHLIEIVV